MREVNIGHASDFADPGRKIIGFERFEIAVFKLGGEFFAYLNHCPHMGGPACQGNDRQGGRDHRRRSHQQGYDVLQNQNAYSLPMARF